MFNATHFTYDGVFSGIYGLLIADFDDNAVVETAAFSPSLNTNKPTLLKRFFHNGIIYDDVPQHQFSIISQNPIGDVLRREIISWLVGRDSFKILKIHQPDLEQYTYKCVFTDLEIIYVRGACHGFRLTANFDSPYQRGEPTKVKVVGTWVAQTIKIHNKSDVKDDYIYPQITFRATSAMSDGYDISILNNTDDTARYFRFSGLYANETVTVDNELRHIESDRAGEKLSNFVDKNWLRLRPGINTLTIAINGTVTITCPTYAMMGF